MSDLERVKAFNPDVEFPCPYCNQQARLADLDDHNNGRCMTAKVTMSEESLMSLTWEVLPRRSTSKRLADRFVLQGTWPSGNHAMFVDFPEDTQVADSPPSRHPICKVCGEDLAIRTYRGLCHLNGKKYQGTYPTGHLAKAVLV